ncbi:MAG: response regulator [Bacteroidota bacterium]|nr:response regulator [Bacteroidota bacterium]
MAEDDEPSQQYLSILIKDFASEILEAKTENEAIELCRQIKDIDLILMDIKMLELDGHQATNKQN